MKTELGSLDPKPTTTIDEMSRHFFRLEIQLAGLPYDDQQVRWNISQRGENGCILTLIATINGQDTEGAQYYVDLEKEMIYPDNSHAVSTLQSLSTVNPSSGFKLASSQ